MVILNRISGFSDEIAPDLETQVASFNKLGISHIEMREVDGNNLIFHSDEKVRSIKSYLYSNGITLSALGSPLGKIGILEDFESHFEDFKRAVEVAHMMETPYIRIFSYYIPSNSDPDIYKEEVFERTGRFVDYASTQDVILLHENEKDIYGEKAAECKKLMDAFYGDHFKATYDFANFIQAGENTTEAYKLLKPYIEYIHVKDALFVDGSVVPAGMGDGNMEWILNDLLKSGFEGYLSIEPHLTDFVGFASLEGSGKKTLLKEGNKLSGFDAFALAHKSLLDIINNYL